MTEIRRFICYNSPTRGPEGWEGQPAVLVVVPSVRAVLPAADKKLYVDCDICALECS